MRDFLVIYLVTSNLILWHVGNVKNLDFKFCFTFCYHGYCLVGFSYQLQKFYLFCRVKSIARG